MILGAGLLVAGAFLGGIQAQRQWGDDSSGGGSGNFAGRFAAANGGTGANAAPGGQTGQGGQGAGGFFGRRGGGFTTGTVKMAQGSTVSTVTTTDGNVVQVSVPAGSTITKSVTTKVSGIKPGESVTAIGTTSNGVVKAISVRVGYMGLPSFRGAGAQGGQGGAQTPPSP